MVLNTLSVIVTARTSPYPTVDGMNQDKRSQDVFEENMKRETVYTELVDIEVKVQ